LGGSQVRGQPGLHSKTLYQQKNHSQRFTCFYLQHCLTPPHTHTKCTLKYTLKCTNLNCTVLTPLFSLSLQYSVRTVLTPLFSLSLVLPVLECCVMHYMFLPVLECCVMHYMFFDSSFLCVCEVFLSVRFICVVAFLCFLRCSPWHEYKHSLCVHPLNCKLTGSFSFALMLWYFHFSWMNTHE
jgi:hypothetical protein